MRENRKIFPPEPQNTPESSWFKKDDELVMTGPSKIGIKRLLGTLNDLMPVYRNLDRRVQEEWEVLYQEASLALVDKGVDVKRIEKKLENFIEAVSSIIKKDAN